MARGIMADKEDNVASPTSEQSTNSTKIRRNSSTLNHNSDDSSNGVSTAAKPVSSSSAIITPTTTATATAAPSPTCSCTKISTMQLFYEMKQKFPTVPDNVVCEFVGQNCHNRSACIDGLEDYPNSANVYPQALRNQPIKRKTMQCAAAVPQVNLNESHQQQQQQKPMTTTTSTKDSNTTDSETMTTTNPTTTTAISHAQRKVAPPTTLNLTNLNCCTRPVNRPTRQAPPPPTTTVTAPPTAAAVAASTTPTQSIKSLSNQPLNLSVNVIVSPVTRTPKSQQSHYSFTLHQPSSNTTPATTIAPHPSSATAAAAAAADVQSAADTIAAKTPTTTTTDAQQYDVPSLTYTSSAYDAEIGYQSRFEITVAGMSAKSNDNNNCDPLRNDNTNEESSGNGNVSLTRSCEITATDQAHQLPSVVASAEFLEETETVHHQILCKQKLVLELEKDRKRLERMQRELLAIQAPMPDGGLDGLSQEIDKLRNDCKVMAQYVEEAGPSYALGETNEAFYRNIYTGQQLPIMQQRPLRPHRPAPVPDFTQIQNRVMNHINLAGNDPRFASSSTAAAAAAAAGGGASSIPQPTPNRSFNETNEDGWVCDLCTFQNKYTQRTCEACTMPFLSAGNQMGCYNNSGLFAPMPMPIPPASTPSPSSLPLSLASPLLSPSQSLQQQQQQQPQQQPYPLAHYMPMQMPIPMPYSIHNNNNNNHIPHVHSSYYRQPQQPKFYVYDTSRF